MSTRTKKLSSDSLTDKSDILSILESIDSMFEIYQNVFNSYTQDALMLAITTEAEMLLLKLNVMVERWKVHLPFKEATTINFYSWGKKIMQMANAIGEDELAGDSDMELKQYCPTKHFLLDLYECLDESSSGKGSAPYFADPDVIKFVNEQAKLQAKIKKKWGDYRFKISALVPHKLDDRLNGVFQPMANHEDDIRTTCYTVLRKLSAVLYELYDTPRGKISHDQFARLAQRVMEEKEYGVPKQAVEHEVKEKKNAIPEDQWEAYCEGEIKAAIDLIKEMKLESKVFGYLGRDKTILENPAGFGRYLWSVRNDISKVDLRNLIELLYRVAYLGMDREQQADEELAVADDAVAARPKDAEGILRERKAARLFKPRLPNFFDRRLAGNKAAIERYYATLHHCGFYIGRALTKAEKNDPDERCYEGWKWKHLREAFVKLGFIRADSPKKGFADHLADVFSFLVSTSVQRGFNDRGGYNDSNATYRIITDMVSEFKEVADLMDD